MSLNTYIEQQRAEELEDKYAELQRQNQLMKKENELLKLGNYNLKRDNDDLKQKVTLLEDECFVTLKDGELIRKVTVLEDECFANIEDIDSYRMEFQRASQIIEMLQTKIVDICFKEFPEFDNPFTRQRKMSSVKQEVDEYSSQLKISMEISESANMDDIQRDQRKRKYDERRHYAWTSDGYFKI
jgi:sulfur transfer complex TusBCD TusB component (DsrH family)